MYKTISATEALVYVLFYLVFTKSCPEYEILELRGLRSYVQNLRRLRLVLLLFL